MSIYFHPLLAAHLEAWSLFADDHQYVTDVNRLNLNSF